jgi:hypothetical protein
MHSASASEVLVNQYAFLAKKEKKKERENLTVPQNLFYHSLLIFLCSFLLYLHLNALCILTADFYSANQIMH